MPLNSTVRRGAGDGLDRFADRLTRQVADLLGRQRVDDGDGIALDRDRGLHGLANGADDDFIDLRGFILRRGRGG
jgi:hypothetical protein